MSSDRPWFLYIVECADTSYYTGITTDVTRRLKQHNTGRGARYTAIRRPVKMMGVWQFPDRGAAMKAEIAVKNKTRSTKLELVESASGFRDGEWVDQIPQDNTAAKQE